MPSLSEAEEAADLPHRRDALRVLAAGVTAALAGCGKPAEEIVPFVRMPERLVPGEPLRYATALPLSGLGRGVLVTAVDGRPIKVEGNARHPASLGATDVFAEAEILSLYDPARSRTVQNADGVASREAYAAVLLRERERLAATGGAGFRILAGPLGSPTLKRQIDALLARYPQARRHRHAPLADEAAREGARLAFGRPLVAMPRLAEAATIVTLGADPLGPGPDSIRLARDYVAARRAGTGFRLYAFEPDPTITGAKADHRAPVAPDDLPEIALALANAFGAGARVPVLPPEAARVVAAALRDMEAAPGRAVVLPGPTLPAWAQALVAWLNVRIGAPVDLLEPADRVGDREPGTLSDLARDLRAGTVDLVLILGCNPAYDAPGDLDLRGALPKARMRIHAGLYRDETARLATWHLPVSHPLESWSDLVGPDGTAAIVQPLIRPLYGTGTLHDVLAGFAGEEGRSSRDLVRETWAAQAGADPDRWWRETLHAGLVPGTAATPVRAPAPTLPAIPPAQAAPTTGREILVVLRPDPCLWDGSYADNAWLQELPKPLTKQVWGHALALGPADADRLGVGAGTIVSLDNGIGRIDVPVLVEPGHAPGCGSLTTGYGREAAGPIGSNIGGNAFRLARAGEPFLLRGVAIADTGRRSPILTTAKVVREPAIVAESLPVLAVADLAAGTARSLATGPLPTLLPTAPRDVDGSAHAWGMVIDNAACIGCNACMVSCQSENNVPVVGPEEIARGRTMHWLRVDVYDTGTPEAPKPGFQPVPCMHCEHAPCEPVCPVAASVHDSEGLNVQVYNRCVGTRFCEANCPYKVRRFNFFGYADGQEYADLGLEAYRAGRNPDVTVRSRGVMEKCTYCVQRISRARRAAIRDGRAMATDEVETACQAACPTRAITFGDLRDPKAAVTGLKADPRHYALLGHLGTRPRTTYLAETVNPSPELKRGGA